MLPTSTSGTCELWDAIWDVESFDKTAPVLQRAYALGAQMLSKELQDVPTLDERYRNRVTDLVGLAKSLRCSPAPRVRALYSAHVQGPHSAAEAWLRELKRGEKHKAMRLVSKYGATVLNISVTSLCSAVQV